LTDELVNDGETQSNFIVVTNTSLRPFTGLVALPLQHAWAGRTEQDRAMTEMCAQEEAMIDGAMAQPQFTSRTQGVY
jgi:hypothetical protein